MSKQNPFDISAHAPNGTLVGMTEAQVGALLLRLRERWEVTELARRRTQTAKATAARWAHLTDPPDGPTENYPYNGERIKTPFNGGRITTGGRGGCAQSAPIGRFNSAPSVSSARALAPHPSARISSALSLLARRDQAKTQTDLSIASGGARARALKAKDIGPGIKAPTPEEFQADAARARIQRRLSGATFPWADASKQRIPTLKVYEAAELIWVCPMLVDYVLERVALEKPANPIGMVFKGLGCGRKPWGEPFEIPLGFSAVWSARHQRIEEATAKLAEIQARIDRERTEAVAEKLGVRA